MSLRQLAEEYAASADKLALGLERVRERQTAARGEEAVDLARRAAVMKLELQVLRSLSRVLGSYYA